MHDPADLELAHRLADLADSIALPAFRSTDLGVERKPDGTEVTRIDIEIERRIRDEIAPSGDRVVGEEMGDTGAGSRRWILDPIDGTSVFIAGRPHWATFIALEVAGIRQVGVVSAPALGRRWWAGAGGGAWTAELPDRARPSPLTVADPERLEDAVVSCYPAPGHPRTVRRAGDLLERAGRVVDAVEAAAAAGLPATSLLVVAGVADVHCFLAGAEWDHAAPAVITEEAGGRYTALDGTSRLDRGAALAGAGRVHRAAVSKVS